MKRLLALLLCTFPALAEPPFLPIAECKDGKCVMSQLDFQKFQQFHAAVYAQVSVLNEQMQRTQGENEELRGQLSRNLHCQLRKM